MRNLSRPEFTGKSAIGPHTCYIILSILMTKPKAARRVRETVPTERGEILDDKVHSTKYTTTICVCVSVNNGHWDTQRPWKGGNAFESSHLFVSPEGIRGGCTLERRVINHALYDAKAAYAIDDEV